MKIYFTDQSEYFPQHLKRLKRESKIDDVCSNLNEKITRIEVRSQTSFDAINLAFLFAYKIFPKQIMTFLSEWEFENREMRVGDTIVQQAFIPPFPKISKKIIFGVRINEIIREKNRVGFSYETLKEHVEMGMSTFTVERDFNSKTIFKIHTFSKPGNLLTKIAGPFFSVPYQAYCTRQGLINVKRQLENSQ